LDDETTKRILGTGVFGYPLLPLNSEMFEKMGDLEKEYPALVIESQNCNPQERQFEISRLAYSNFLAI